MEDFQDNGTVVYTNPRHRKRVVTANWEIIIEPGEQEIIIRARGRRVGGRHQRLVEALVRYLVHSGYKVRADGINVPSEARLNIQLNVGRARIDVIAYDGFKYQYYEVKTLPELASDHTRRQLLEYSRELEHFHLVVPPEAVSRAKDVIRLLGLVGRVTLVVVHDRGSGEVPDVEVLKVGPAETDIYPEGTKPEW